MALDEKASRVMQNNKVWIVIDQKGYDVELKSFSEALRNPDDVQIQGMTLANILKKDTTGSDGKKVTFNIGDLVMMTYKDLPDGMQLHFCNVGPRDVTTQLQYDYVLIRLGLKKAVLPNLDTKTIFTDGQFRAAAVDHILKKEKKDESN